jgi:hypothetical protein
MPSFKLKRSPSSVRYTPKAVKHEEALQKQVCHWLKLNYPNIIFRSDYASDLNLTQNQARTHANLQSGRSFPDLFIYSAQRGYHGMALELKTEGTIVILKRGDKKGHLTSDPHIREQFFLLKQLRSEGYWTNFGIGFDDCIELIQWYFGTPKLEQQKLF